MMRLDFASSTWVRLQGQPADLQLTIAVASPVLATRRGTWEIQRLVLVARSRRVMPLGTVTFTCVSLQETQFRLKPHRRFMRRERQQLPAVLVAPRSAWE